jgi:hypothetical protein
MPKSLTIELPDEVYDLLVRSATRSGQTPEQWLVARLQAALVTAEQRAAEMARLWGKVVDMPPQPGSGGGAG